MPFSEQSERLPFFVILSHKNPRANLSARGKLMATAAIKLRAEVACKLCRSVAVKTKGQWLTAKSPKRKTKNSRLSSFFSRLIYSKAIRTVRLYSLASQLTLQRGVVLGNLQGLGIEQVRLCLHIQLLHHLRHW